MVKVGIIGCGYWGPNYIRTFSALDGSEVVVCCDLDEENLNGMKIIVPTAKLIHSYKEVAEDPDVDAVVITTPLNNHYSIAKTCLENNKHVLIEKPFTSTAQEAGLLMEIAKKSDRILMVGHIYEYNPGVLKLKEIIDNGDLGDIYYMFSERVGLGPIRKHASALWDLSTHDISVALFLLGELPESVTAVGESYVQEGVGDCSFLSLRFPSRVTCTVYSSWIAPEKIRKTTVVGSKGMVVLDDVNKTENLKVYMRTINKELLDSTPEYSDHQLVISIGDVSMPVIEQTEPLKNQAKHFLECIVENKEPLTGAEDGLNVIKVLEAAEESLNIQRTVQCR